jgi:hypothetical protein
MQQKEDWFTDLVRNLEERLDAMDGKATVVCISRRICVDLYSEIVKLPVGRAKTTRLEC